MGRSIRLSRVLTQVGHIAHQIGTLPFSSYCALVGWKPALNAYRYEDHYAICIDLAGVSSESIDLRVESHRLTVRGARQPPERNASASCCKQILALEIESGEFSRQIDFSVAVDSEHVEARQENGLLWVHLPLRSSS